MTVHQKAYLRQNNALLAAYLEHFDSIAEEVDQKGGRSEDYYLKQTAHRLKANVRSLRQVSHPELPRLAKMQKIGENDASFTTLQKSR